MLAAVGLLIVGFQDTSAPVPFDNPSKFVSKVFRHYFDAQSLSGKVRLTQSAKGTTVTVDTEIAYDRPSKFLIRQVSTGVDARKVAAVSDGRIFSYDKPPQVHGKDVLRELVFQNGQAQTIDQMYGAASASIIDRSPILDIAFAGKPDLLALKAHWTSLRFNGKIKIGERDGISVVGDYGFLVGMEPTGTFEMDATESGDLLRYTLKNRYSIDGQLIVVDSIWDADLKIGVTNDDRIYVR